MWVGIENACILPNRLRINLSIWNPWALSWKNRVLVVPHPSAGYAAHVFMFSVTLKYIQPLLAYRRAFCGPNNTSDNPHRQTRELSIDRLYRHPCKPDAPVPQQEHYFRGPDPYRQDRGKAASRPQETIAPERPPWGTPIIKREYYHILARSDTQWSKTRRICN